MVTEENVLYIYIYIYAYICVCMHVNMFSDADYTEYEIATQMTAQITVHKPILRFLVDITLCCVFVHIFWPGEWPNTNYDSS